ncbi:MAG TPA: metal-dependent hydrolase [Candidatus Solibacter sp.]|nr:metal-dependent hydrolase [Candidatus Solibacter sp.]
MDIVTHGLASLAVARGFFPRAGKLATAGAVLAGCIADIDWLSSYFGPSAFLTWHGTYAHSIFVAVIISAIFPAMLLAAVLWGGLGIEVELQEGEALFKDPRPARNRALLTGLVPLFFALFLPAMLHIAMDACQSDGVMLFWPFSSRRFAADWLPSIDPWILTILIGAIALPELLRLVGSEIGSREKKPRGQTGAIVGLALVLVYVGVRATLHSSSTALMTSRTFHGETPRRVRAYPESISILTWHGAVETESALDKIDVNSASPGEFDPDSSVRFFKPEPSPALDAARNTTVARRFLATAQIPRASVEKLERGYAVTLRDFRYAASGEANHEIAAYIEVNLNNKVASQELVWARDLKND